MGQFDQKFDQNFTKNFDQNFTKNFDKNFRQNFDQLKTSKLIMHLIYKNKNNYRIKWWKNDIKNH